MNDECKDCLHLKDCGYTPGTVSCKHYEYNDFVTIKEHELEKDNDRLKNNLNVIDMENDNIRQRNRNLLNEIKEFKDIRDRLIKEKDELKSCLPKSYMYDVLKGIDWIPEYRPISMINLTKYWYEQQEKYRNEINRQREFIKNLQKQLFLTNQSSRTNEELRQQLGDKYHVLEKKLNSKTILVKELDKIRDKLVIYIAEIESKNEQLSNTISVNMITAAGMLGSQCAGNLKYSLNMNELEQELKKMKKMYEDVYSNWRKTLTKLTDKGEELEDEKKASSYRGQMVNKLSVENNTLTDEKYKLKKELEKAVLFALHETERADINFESCEKTERKLEKEKDNQHNCQHCFKPLNATKYLGVYECPNCLSTYPHKGNTLNELEQELGTYKQTTMNPVDIEIMENYEKKIQSLEKIITKTKYKINEFISTQISKDDLPNILAKLLKEHYNMINKQGKKIQSLDKQLASSNIERDHYKRLYNELAGECKLTLEAFESDDNE